MRNRGVWALCCGITVEGEIVNLNGRGLAARAPPTPRFCPMAASPSLTFMITGSRLEGRVPLAHVRGTAPQFMKIEAEFGADSPSQVAETEDDYPDSELGRMFRVGSGLEIDPVYTRWTAAGLSGAHADPKAIRAAVLHRAWQLVPCQFRTCGGIHRQSVGAGDGHRPRHR